jgi:hypothetical protein
MAITNQNRPAEGETWATISTKWNTETRTWAEARALIRNKFAGYYITWDAWTTPWEDESRTWDTLKSTGITNQGRENYKLIWNDWTTVWNNETRTWDGLPNDNMTNINRPA